VSSISFLRSSSSFSFSLAAFDFAFVFDAFDAAILVPIEADEDFEDFFRGLAVSFEVFFVAM
jgi:hypothetical protein